MIVAAIACSFNDVMYAAPISPAASSAIALPAALLVEPAVANTFSVQHDIQCQQVRGVNAREMNAIGHTPARFKRAGVGTNGILECKYLSKNAHRTPA
jgi:hypothetical protein